MEQNSTPLSPAKAVYLFYFASIFSIFIYAAVLFFIEMPFSKFPELDVLGIVLIGLSVLFAFASFKTTPFFLKPYWAKFQTEYLSNPNIEALKIKADQTYFSVFVIRSALVSAIAIFGLVYAFLVLDGLIYIPFALASLFLHAISRPNVQKDLIEKVQGNSAPSVIK